MTTSATRPHSAAAGQAPPAWLWAILSDTGQDGYLAVFDRPAPSSAARLFVTAALTEWQRAEAVFDTQLVVSELIANAMRHGGGAVSLELAVCGTHVGCAVSDRSPAAPLPTTETDHLAEYGRGLHLVQALTHDWGWHPAAAGKRVWAVLR